MNNTPRQMAMLVAGAAVLQIAESLIPHPVPGIRLGLANMVALVALYRWDVSRALEITLFRTVVSALLMGTLFAPPFLLSVGGGTVSTLLMAGMLKMMRHRRRPALSLLGISVAGAFVHNLTQLTLVYLLLIPHRSLFLLMPWLALGAVVAGWINGWVAAAVCRNLETEPGTSLLVLNGDGQDVLQDRQYSPARGWLHQRSVHLKIALLMALGVSVLIIGQLGYYLILLALLLVVITTARLSLRVLFGRVWRLRAILLFSLLIPALSRAGAGDVNLGVVSISSSGLLAGFGYALRLILLMTATLILVSTTPAERLAADLCRWLRPLSLIGLNAERSASILTEAWLMMPELWGTLRQSVRGIPREPGRIRSLMAALSLVIAGLYRDAESQTV